MVTAAGQGRSLGFALWKQTEPGVWVVDGEALWQVRLFLLE